jgi:hypothetical protein
MPTKEEETMLDSFRSRPCDLCGAPPPSHVHHVLAKGIGNGREINHRWNCLSLCLQCHSRVHSCGTMAILQTIVARREGTTFDRVQEKIRELRNVD